MPTSNRARKIEKKGEKKERQEMRRGAESKRKRRRGKVRRKEAGEKEKRGEKVISSWYVSSLPCFPPS